MDGSNEDLRVEQVTHTCTYDCRSPYGFGGLLWTGSEEVPVAVKRLV